MLEMTPSAVSRFNDLDLRATSAGRPGNARLEREAAMPGGDGH
jgi:hypothetical protein